jgi:hypothetical protein
MPEDQHIQYAGLFRGKITSLGLKENASGSIQVPIRCVATAMYNPESNIWEDWSQYGDYSILGWPTIRNKDGQPNEIWAEMLIRALGWDGQIVELAEIDNNRWNDCQFEIITDQWKGEDRLKVSALYPYNRDPVKEPAGGGGGGGLGNVESSRAQQLDNEMGGALRAIVGNVMNNAVPPPVVPTAPAEELTKEEADDLEGGIPDDDIPFEEESTPAPRKPKAAGKRKKKP